MNKVVMVLGSARSNGNTKMVLDHIQTLAPNFQFVDLKNKQIAYFDYDHSNLDDDFIPTIEYLLSFDLILFASPVYWYSMSAQMKTFFDRITDLLKARHDLGVQLKGKKMASLSCSGDDDLPDGFIMPFENTAEYLHMHYAGHCHTWVNNGINAEAIERVVEFVETLKSF